MVDKAKGSRIEEMGNDKDNIEMMVPYTLNDDTPNGDTPNDKNPNEDTSNINNESKATIPGTSSNQGRKVIINPTDDEILAAQGLLQLFQEARVFSTSKVSAFKLSYYKTFHLSLKTN